MILKTVFRILIVVWVSLASILLVVYVCRGLVWMFKKLNDICKTWEEWILAFLCIDVVLMTLVGLLILGFS